MAKFFFLSGGRLTSLRPTFAAPGVVLLLWLLAAGAARAQVDTTASITRQYLRYERRGPQEKLFLHLDRPVYLSGEIMWFKVYASEGTHARPLPLSSVAYVEVLDQDQHPVLQGKVELKKAIGQGSFSLPAALPSGTYTVRAYTSWMQNFSPDTYFQAPVTVLNTALASAPPAARRDSATFDAQFFPEGGNLVNGLSSTVAFKATDPSGRGTTAQGTVLDRSGRVVATLSTQRLGMGTFTITPTAAGSPYTAVLTYGKQVVRRPLPTGYEQGYVVHLTDTDAENLTLTVASTTRQETVFLLGHSGQRVAIAAQAGLVQGRTAFLIKKAQLLDGISHFTVFNASQQPVCERLYFKQPQQRLRLEARLDHPQYTPRDKVSVQLTADGAPASLSMAVYRLDSLNAAPVPTIAHYLWLTSDLKGHIENPDYYFTAPAAEAAAAADNLMLTQGWSRFRWEDILTPKPLEFLPEPYGPVIRGRLTVAGTTTPRQGVLTYLSSPSRVVQLNNSLSNADGLVQFEMNNFYGGREIMVQTDPNQDSTCQITLFDPFSTRYAARRLPAAFTLIPRFGPDYARRHLQSQVQNAYFGKARNRYLLPAVDSQAFYGRPDEAYFLDKYTRFKVLEEVMREYVPGVVVRIRKDGFHFMVLDNLHKTVFEQDPMVLLDGVPVFNLNKLMAFNPLKVRKLEVLDRAYIHGLAIYRGLVSFNTYQGNLEGFPLDPRVLVKQYEGLQLQREFYAPRYASAPDKESRLPDLRNLLYWNPNITTTGPTALPLEFYTGDQAGRYLLVVQGLSATGQAGSSSQVLEVKPAL